MSTDATTLPLRDAPPERPEGAGGRRRIVRGGRPLRVALDPEARAHRERTLAAAILVGMVLAVAVIVIAAADRPSFLSSPSHLGFFPHWLAGPLGGRLPWLTRSPQVLKSLMTGVLVSMYCGYVVALRYLPQLRARWVIGAIVALHAILFLSPPLVLTDVFNYINYGRMGMVHHLNPYTTIPALEPHSDPSFDLSNWHNLLSPYGPLFTLVTYAVVPLGVAGSLWALKSLLMAASLATILLVWKCARLLGRDPVSAIALVGLNPIVLMWGLGGDHNDFLTVFFVVLGLYLLLSARTLHARTLHASPAGNVVPPRTRVRAWLASPAACELGAGLALVTAMMLKASAGILLPIALASLARTPRRLMWTAAGMALAGVVWGACSILAFGPHLPSLGTQGTLVIAVSLPNLLGLLLGQGGETDTLRTLLSLVLVAACLAAALRAWRRQELLAPAGWATVALLVTLSWVLPWYVLWVLPLAALADSPALRRAALALTAYLILTWMPLATAMDSALGFYPSKTPLGQLHQRYIRELLN